MEDSIRSLQTKDLLQARYVKGTSALTKNQKSSLIFIYAKILQELRRSGNREWWEISIDDMMDHLDGSKGGNQSILVWDQIQKINQTQILITYEDENGDLRERMTHLVTEIDRPVTASGCFKVKISDQVLKNIQYREDVIYRWIELKYARKLSSPKHMDLYEILKAAENLSHFTISLEDLKAKTNLHDAYPVFSQFKKWVLDPATKDINKHTDLNIKWTPIRGKRQKVESVTFTIKKGGGEKGKKASSSTATAVSDLVKKLEARGIRNPEQFDLPDPAWEKSLQEEPADAKAGHIVETARSIHQQEEALKSDAIEKEKRDATADENRKWWKAQIEEGLVDHSLVDTSDSYLQPREGSPILYSDPGFRDKAQQFLRSPEINEESSSEEPRSSNFYVDALKVLNHTDRGNVLATRIKNEIRDYSSDRIRHKDKSPERILHNLVGRASKENPEKLNELFLDVFGPDWRQKAEQRISKRSS